MSRSGSFETNHVSPVSNTWWIEFNWSSSYSGNNATIYWNAYLRCSQSGSARITLYNGNVTVNGASYEFSGMTNRDTLLASGSFSTVGGNSFGASASAGIYSSGTISSGNSSWTLDRVITVTTPTITCSIKSRGLNTISASMSVTNNGGASIRDYYIDLFSDSGCTNKVGTINGTSGTFTGLSPNTTYYARANSSNGTYRGYSPVVTTSTYNIATISSAPNIKHGDNLKIDYSNPSGSEIKTGIYTIDGTTALASYRICSSNSYIFKFTDEELDKIYKLYGSGKTIKVRVCIQTADTYTNYKEITITLTGNQKTIKVKEGNKYYRAILWIQIDNIWYRAIIWVNINKEEGGNPIWKKAI